MHREQALVIAAAIILALVLVLVVTRIAAG
jgi:hypothetical protein